MLPRHILTLVLTLHAAAQQRSHASADPEPLQESKAPDGVGGALPKAYVDGMGLGWRTLAEADFAEVNGDPNTRHWDDERGHIRRGRVDAHLVPADLAGRSPGGTERILKNLGRG